PRPSRTSPPGGRKLRPSLTATARDGRTIVRVGTEEWLRRGPNQRMARHRRATCRQIRSANPKLSPLHGTGASPDLSWAREAVDRLLTAVEPHVTAWVKAHPEETPPSDVRLAFGKPVHTPQP